MKRWLAIAASFSLAATATLAPPPLSPSATQAAGLSSGTSPYSEGIVPSIQAQAQAQPLCFQQTGQCISAEFRQYWEQNGGLPVFGYPITPSSPQIDAASGSIFLTQWFERNSFELHPENQPPYNVLLGRLGNQLLSQAGTNPSTLPKAAPSTPHYYAVTAHAIAAQFWDYWSGHGLEMGDAGTTERESIALFGYPISEPRMEKAANGQTYLTQWFERARFEYHPENSDPDKVLLGLLGDEMKPLSPSAALNRLNYYRQMVGTAPVQQQASLVVSAQSHANYLLLNGDAGTPHHEAAGGQGFSGAEIIDRVKAAGYAYQSGYSVSEVLVPQQEPVASVDTLIDLPLHRVPMLSPTFREAGYGRAVGPVANQKGGPAYSVIDLGTGPMATLPPGNASLIAYPVDGQKDIPYSWSYIEGPDPLPGGAKLPTGYPFTLQGVYGTLYVDTAEMRDSGGQSVQTYPNPALCTTADYNCLVLTPTSPLQPGAAYSVHVKGVVGATSFDKTWQFTTGSTTTPK